MYPKLNELLPNFWREQPKERKIGIEIEVEGDNLRIEANPNWTSVFDGSLRGNPDSLEYVLKRPVSIKMVPIVLDRLKGLIEQGKARLILSDRCGVHIHFNVQHATVPEILNFICLYLIVEGLLLRYCGESREGNFFCLRASDAEYIIERILEFRKTNDPGALFANADTLKYAALNIGAVGEHGSLEFRSLLTPKDFSDINDWVTLLNAVKKSIGEYETPVNMIEAFSFQGPMYFVRNVFKKTFPILCKKVKMGEIEELVFRNMRLVQDIAYTQPVKPLITLEDLKKKKAKEVKNIGEMQVRWKVVNDQIVQEAIDEPPIQPRRGGRYQVGPVPGEVRNPGRGDPDVLVARHYLFQGAVRGPRIGDQMPEEEGD